MRLINADEHECWACIHHQNDVGRCDTWCDAGESFELREDVKNAKTAYDVKTVVKALEKLERKYMNNSEKAAELGMGYEKHMIYYGAKGNAFAEAIDIVKKNYNTSCVLR